MIHDKSKYDLIDGKIDRSLGYNKALAGISSILNQNQGIKVVIDLHRDAGINGEKSLATINGVEMARVMFFNGLSRGKNGDIAYLNNLALEGNLAFSLQLKCKAMELYPELTKPIYLKGYRYNLHVRERSLLVELGNQNNTVQEAKNAMKPLAHIIASVLEGK